MPTTLILRSATVIDAGAGQPHCLQSQVQHLAAFRLPRLQREFPIATASIAEGERKLLDLFECRAQIHNA